ncbi:hypothetical protein KKG56_12520 [bacterium]|nr:hypothetical protein [bacterium]
MQYREDGTETWTPAAIGTLTAGSTTVTIALTGTNTEGTRTVYLQVIDAVRWNSGTITDTIILDTTVPQVPPSGSITVIYPTSQTRAKENDVVTITAVVEDSGAGINQITLDASNIGGSKNQPMYPATQTGVYLAHVIVLKSPMGTESLPNISVTAHDKAGNEASSTTTIFVDNKMPIFSTVNTPLSVYRNNDMLQVIAKLDSGSYTVSVDLSGLDDTYQLGAGTSTVTPEGTYTIIYQIGTANTTPDGSYELKLRAQDEAGNISWRSTSVLLDNTAPVQLLKAEPSIVRNGDTIVFTYYGTDPGLPITEIPLSEILKLDSNASGSITLHDDGSLPDMVSGDGIYTASYTISATNTISGTLTGGLVTIGATIVDLASNTLHAKVTITLDNTKPGVELIAIDRLQAVNNLIILGTATENITNIVRAEYRLDDVNIWFEATPRDGLFDENIEAMAIVLTNLTDGTHTVTAHAEDLAGNVSDEVKIGFQVDTIGPIISNLRVTPDPTNGTTSVFGTATDSLNNITKVEYYIDTLPQGTLTTGIQMTGTGSIQTDISGTISIAGLTNGKHFIYVRAQDILGNWGSVQKTTFTISKSKLLVYVNPVTPDPIGTTNITISGYAVDVHAPIKQIEVCVDSNSWIMATITDGNADEFIEEYTCQLPANQLNSGSHKVTVKATDMANTTGIIMDSFVVDLATSTLTMSTLPQWANSRVIITGTATDQGAVTGIVKVEYQVDGEQVWQTAVATDGAYDAATETFRIEISGLNDGTHTVTARSMDMVGNVSDEVQIGFQVDTTGPIISNLMVTPDPTNGSSSLTGTATDSLNIIAKVEYYIDTLPQGTGTQMTGTGSKQTSISGVIDIIGLTEGKHTIYVHAQDMLGNWGSVQQVVFAVSKSRLFVEINPVTPDPIGTTNITIIGRVIAPQVAIKQIDVQIDNGSWIPAQIADTIADELVEGYACVLPPGSLTDGVHTIVVRATDIANTVGFGTETFEVDTQASQVIGISPRYPTGQLRAKEGDVITIMAQITPTDVDIARVTLDASMLGGSVDQTMYLASGGNVYQAQTTLSDTTMGTESQQTIVVTVEDRAGNLGTGTENVFVDNKPPVFSTVQTTASVYKNGDVVTITAKLDSNTYAVTVDFSGFDNTYGSATVTTTSEGTYTITYRIGTANTIPDGSYGLVIRAVDQAGNAAVRATSVRLDNTAPGQLLKAEPAMVRNGDMIVVTYQAGEVGLRTAEIPAAMMQRFDSTAGTLTLHMVSNDGIYAASYTVSATNTISGTITSITATIMDMAGNTLQPQVTITVDNTLPMVQMGTISAMQSVSSLTILGTATDSMTGIVSGEFMLDDTGIWHEAIPKDGQFNAKVEPFAIVMQGLAEGSHTVTARLRDMVGNIGTQTISFCVDTQGPGTISLSLTPEIVITGTSTLLTATITDAISSVNYAEYYIDAYPKPQPDGVLNIFSPDLTVVCGEAIYVATLTEGNHIVYVRASDEAGNWSGIQSAMFRVGKGGIGVVIETQDNMIGTTAEVVSGYVNAFTYKVIGIEYRVGTGTWGTITTLDGRFDELKEEFTIRVTGLKEGTNTIEVRGLDEVENAAADSVSICVDTAAPVGSMVINNNATYTTSREVFLSMSYGDDAAMVRYSNASDFSLWEPPATTKGWMLPPQDGTWTVSYQVQDVVGNIAEFSDSIILDTKPPAFIGAIASDRTAYRSGDTINLTAKTDGTGYTITAWLLPIDSTEIVPLTMIDKGDGTYTLTHTIGTDTKSPDGAYPILITATDKAGNVKQISVSLKLDNATPMYGLSVDPALPPVVGNGHVLTFVYAGAESKLPTTIISLNYNGTSNLLLINGSATTDLALRDDGIAPDKVKDDGVYIGTCAVKTAIEGTITVYATIVNSVGNVMNPWTSIRVDNKPPSIGNIAVAYPAGQSRAKEGDTIAINVTVTDAMLSTVKLDAHELNGESAEEMSYNKEIGTYTAQVSVVDVHPDWTKTITIISTDEAGNISTATTTVMIDNQSPRFSLLDTDRSLYKNGWTMTITAVLDDSSDKIIGADFSSVDSGYRVGSEAVSYQGNTYTITYRITDTNTAPNGVYSIPVKAIDDAGNVEVRSVSAELNNLERIGVFSVTPDRAKLGDKVVFTYTSYQSGLGVAIPAVPDAMIGTLSLTDANNGVYVGSVTISGTNSGTYTIRAEVRDRKGKLFSESEVQLYLRTMPPVLSLPEELYANIEPKPINVSGKWEVYHEHIRLTGTISETASCVWWESKAKYGRIMGPIPNNRFFFDDIYLEQGTNTIKIFAMDDIGNIASQTLTLLYIKPRATIQLGIGGGSVDCPNGSSVFLPQGALQETMNVSIIALPPEIEKEDKKPCSPNTELMGIPHQVEPNIVFHEPVTVTLAYTDIEIERFATRLGTTTDAVRQRLVILFWDEYSHDWIKVGGKVMRGTNTVSITVNHATIYDIGLDVGSVTTAGKVFVYVTKNPFRHGEQTQFVADLPENNLVSIRIFDLSGDLVRTVVRDKNFDSGVNVNLGAWDGLNDYGDFVGTGIYIYQVEIEHGGKTERIAKPIGVVK